MSNLSTHEQLKIDVLTALTSSTEDGKMELEAMVEFFNSSGEPAVTRGQVFDAVTSLMYEGKVKISISKDSHDEVFEVVS